MKSPVIHALGTAALVAAVLGMGCNEPSVRVESVPSPRQEQVTGPVTTSTSKIPVSADVFLDIARFHMTASVTSTSIAGRPVAGVVNHHALASDFLTRFFESFCTARPDLERVIILSPDHYQQGMDSISVSPFPYITRGQTLEIDAEALELLRSHGIATASRKLFEREHGIGALVPFLARSCGDVSLVPIVVRADATPERLESFAEILTPLMDTRTAIIVSADMSHYLREDEALKNDIQTETWLRELDGNELLEANDDFTDNGRSFTVLFSIFRRLGVHPTFQKLDHSISSSPEYGGPDNFTTSYITGVWSTK